MSQISLTKEQLIRLEKAGVEKVQKQLDAGNFGSYRAPLIATWVAEEPKRKKEAKRLEKLAADEAKEKAKKAVKPKEADTNETE